MNMQKWAADTIAADSKKALPVLSFPGIQELGVTVRELVESAELQADTIVAVAKRCPTAAAVSFMDLSVEAEAFGSEIVFSDDEVPTVVGAIVDEDSDPDDLSTPHVGDGRTGLCVEAIRLASQRIEDRPVLAGMIGPFSLAGRLMDVNEIMMLCYEEPELCEGVVEKVTDFLVEYAQAFKDAGADGVVMAEPLAGLLPPALLADFSTPYVKRIVDAVQDDAFTVVYHNCGPTVVKAAEGVAATGAAAFHFGNAINMIDILPLMPADALVMGNVDPVDQLRDGTPESVHAATLAVLEACADHPNFVVSTGCDVPPKTSWENIDAFFAAVEEFYAK